MTFFFILKSLPKSLAFPLRGFIELISILIKFPPIGLTILIIKFLNFSLALATSDDRVIITGFFSHHILLIINGLFGKTFY